MALNLINIIWPLNHYRIPNNYMEGSKGLPLHDKPVYAENGDLDSVDILEDEKLMNLTKDVTGVNHQDSSANQNSFPIRNLTQEVGPLSNDQHSDGVWLLAAESDQFSGKSSNLNDDDLILKESSNDETDTVNNLNDDDDSLGLHTLFDESLQCVDASKLMSQSKKRSRQRKKGNGKLNAPAHNIDLHCDDESLGLENLFDEDLQRRDAARWAIRGKLKSIQRKKEKRKRKRQLSSLCDNDDTDSASTNVNEEDYSSSKPKKKPKRIVPNYFIAIRVSNPHIHSGVKIIQDSIVTHNEKLKPALIPLATLHLTLLVVHLEDEEQIQKATEILHQCRKSLEPILQNDTLTLNFAGLDHFRHQVLFVKLCGKEEMEGLNTVANIVKETFAEEGIPSTDSREFNPHLTVMKLTRSPKLRKQGIKKIPVESYTTWADLNFGEEPVTGLHLCSMNKKDKDGFYKCVASVTFDTDNKASNEPPPAPANIAANNNLKALESDKECTSKEHQDTDTNADLGDGQTVQENDSYVSNEDLE